MCTLFGSKDALVGALGVRTMKYLGREVHASTASNDPVADVVAAGLVFRRFALEHPALCSVAFHRASAAVWPLFRDAAAEAFGALQLWFEPLERRDCSGTGPRPMRRFSSMPCARGSPGWSYAATHSGPTRKALGAALSPRWSPASPRHRPTIRTDPTPLRTRRQHPDRRRPELVQTPDTSPTARPEPLALSQPKPSVAALRARLRSPDSIAAVRPTSSRVGASRLRVATAWRAP